VNYPALQDSDLIRLIADRRDDDALSALYDRYSRLVYSVALQLLGDPGRAEEVTLDVFTRVWEKSGIYDSARAKVQTWIVSMARNRAIDLLRRADARLDDYSVDLADVAYRLEADSDTPEQAVVKGLQASRVRAALTELPDEQQRVVLLAYYRGYTQRQIAEELGLPLGTVKTRVRLAMEKLRVLLAEEQTDPEPG
jgi:RNA polymerase sigma-70 factor (ECF subfamily)